MAGELLAAAAARLDAAGVSTPRVDAELMLAHVLGVPRTRVRLAEAVHPSAVAALDRMLVRRARREPLQHILGSAPFRHLELAVGPGVFVPRPETELLVDAVLAHLRPITGPTVVDLCAGTGALGLAIADELPGAVVHAVEIAPAALLWLGRNTVRTAITIHEADVADPDLLDELRGGVDAVVCNPPYVPSTLEVEPEVRADPDRAVFAGCDGLALMPAVIARAGELLRAGGVLALEHDDTQGVAVPALLAGDGRWHEIADHRDLSGRPRFTTAQRR